MSPDAERLLSALRVEAGSKRRLDLRAIRRAHLAAFPGDAGTPEQRRRLATLIDELPATDVRLPKHARGWDAARPALPAWLVLPPRPSAAPSAEHQTIPWAPELAFIATLTQFNLFDEAMVIQRFLAEGGHQREMIPARERSIDLFGDEKRLDALVRTQLFGDGRLDLETLRCFAVPPPLVYCEAACSGPILIVENHHTWHSLKRWNAQAMACSVIVYGAGAQIRGRLDALLALVAEASATRLLYFGDLDSRGLSIARELNDLCLGRGLPRVQPARRLYRLLLDRGEERRPTSMDKQVASRGDLAWLGDELARRFEPWSAQGLRLAQELVGWDQLREAGGQLVQPDMAERNHDRLGYFVGADSQQQST